MAQDVTDLFLNTNHFAEAVTYTPSGGSGTLINVIWDDAFEVIEMEEDMQVRRQVVACFADQSDITGNSDGDTIDRNSVTYYVTRKLGGDSVGMVILLLSKRAIHGG